MIRAVWGAVALASVAGCVGDGSRDAPEPRERRNFGYIRSLDFGSRTLRFDEAQFLTGKRANAAAAADGAIRAGEAVPNDYYIRNHARTTELLRLGRSVRVTAVRCPTSCRDGVPGTLEGLAASFRGRPPRSLRAPYRGPSSQYWVTVSGDVVVAIDEQYLP